MAWNTPIPSEVISNPNGEAERPTLSLRSVHTEDIQYEVSYLVVLLYLI